ILPLHLRGGEGRGEGVDEPPRRTLDFAHSTFEPTATSIIQYQTTILPLHLRGGEGRGKGVDGQRDLQPCPSIDSLQLSGPALFIPHPRPLRRHQTDQLLS